MIVKRSWSTTAKKAYGFYYGSETFSYKRVNYRGYFLFGIIPIFIDAYSTEYSK